MAIIEALDPTAEVKKRAQRPPNPYPGDMNGKVLAFLNGDGGGQHLRIDNLFNAVEAKLKEKYQFAEILHRAKFRQKSGQGAAEDTLNELANRTDLVINGVGL